MRALDPFVRLLPALLLTACASAPVPGPVAPAVPVAQPAAPAAAAPDLGERLPLDPAVRHGRLANGLTFYIRPNQRPAERAELWLAVDAGSVLEDDDQRGLAHFVEHMAFNGTRRFAKQELVDYLERIGMTFGPDVNASTGFDRTVYTLTVPTEDPEVLETAFEILADWAGGIAFEEEEIDRERGVVVEEWRLGRGAGARIDDEQVPLLFRGSRYAERLPIGEREVIETAPPEALRRFYRDWYRPGLMAVVAVGDFDPETVEGLVRRHLGGLAGPDEPRPRPEIEVPGHDETIFGIVTDPEATATVVEVYHKLPRRPEETAGDYRRLVVEGLYSVLLNARLDEIARRPDAPFLFAVAGSESLVRPLDVHVQAASVAEGQVERGLLALLTEIERVVRHGFTAGELERARANLLRSLESAAEERDHRRSDSYAAELLRHFLEGEASPGIDAELALTRALLPGIALEEVEGLARESLSGGGRVILVSAPQKDAAALPGEAELAAVFEAARAAEVEPWVDRVAEAPLLAAPPPAGEIVEESEVPEVGLTLWRLSNGVRVALKPTDFRNDQVLLAGFSPGGHSLVADEAHTSARFAAALAEQGGLGAFDAVELEKALAGKLAGVEAYIGELEEGVRGGASPRDLETLFQLVYLTFTAPRRDEEAAAALLARLEERVRNRLASPSTVFADRLLEVMTGGHPRHRPLSQELVAEVDLDTALEVYHDRFGDAGDFTFLLVGSFEPEQVREPVATYLGGLPAAGREESWRDVGVEPPEGVVEVEVVKGLEPQSRVEIVFHGEAEFSRQAIHDIGTLGALLRLRLREVLREELGGTYGVQVGGSVSDRPRQRYRFGVGFGCAPENVEELVAAVFAEIEAFQEQGPGEDDLAKVREQQLRSREVALEENGFWLGVLESYLSRGWDPRLILAYDELVESVTAEIMRQAARRYLDRERYVLAVLRPEAEPAPEEAPEGEEGLSR